MGLVANWHVTVAIEDFRQRKHRLAARDSWRQIFTVTLKAS
jgi:hypothetical protein